MPETYKQAIARLIAATPFAVDPDIQMTGKPPTMASSEFLTNKEQGDWAEQAGLYDEADGGDHGSNRQRNGGI
jgi:hypothetical protein